MSWLNGHGHWIIPMLSTVSYALSLLAPAAAIGLLWLAYRAFRSLREKSSMSATAVQGAAEVRRELKALLITEGLLLAVFLLIAFGLLVAALGMSPAMAFLLGAVCALAVIFGTISSGSQAAFLTAEALQAEENTQASAVLWEWGYGVGALASALGVSGIGFMFYFFLSPDAVANMVGFAFGASIVALIGRVGGGVMIDRRSFDGPRSGDAASAGVSSFVGSAAGWVIDVFESHVGALLATMVLASFIPAEAMKDIALYDGSAESELAVRRSLVGLPLVLAFLGLLTSAAAHRLARPRQDEDLMRAMRKTLLLSTVLFLAASLVVVFALSPIRTVLWFPILLGTCGGFILIYLSECLEFPHESAGIAQNSASNVSAHCPLRLMLALKAAALPSAAMAVAFIVAHYCGGLYGVGLSAIGMLSSAGFVLSARMAHETAACASAVAGTVDARAQLGGAGRGERTAADSRLYPTITSILAALVIFGAYSHVVSSGVALSLVDPVVLVGLLAGSSAACLFSSLTVAAAARVKAGGYTEQAEANALKGSAGGQFAAAGHRAFHELVVPGLLILFLPMLIALLGAEALGGMVVGVILCGGLLSLFGMSLSAHEPSARGDQAGGSPAEDGSMSCADILVPAMNVLMILTSSFALVLAPVL